MSGERLTPEGEPAGEGRRAYRFRMNHPVAPYLIAIAAGDLAFRELGPHTGVWTEPAMLDEAARELVDTERMFTAAEQLYGPYRWGRYDMIVLPPAFPYGGMENPTLTFLTPTLIAGDRSLVGTVAHELAHSWSGNLVTNAVWADGWLNEGFTSYFENRIMEAIYGRERAAQEAALGWDEMQKALVELGANSPHTRLHDDSDDPDGGSSGIVYDKGSIFLRTIERAVGRERFDAWLRAYFDRHAFQPMTSARFLADLRENLIARRPVARTGPQARPVGLSAGPARQCGPAGSGGFRRGRPGDAGVQRRRGGERSALCAVELGGTGPFPERAAARAAACAPGRARPRVQPVGQRQFGGAVRLAAARAGQPLRSGGAGGRAVPDRNGPAQVRRAPVRNPGRRRRMGPADRSAHLCPGAERLPCRHDAGRRPHPARGKLRKLAI